MKILIVDDEAPARQRLAGLVQAVGGHELVGEAATGADAVAACERLKPDVVLLDIRMPGGDGLEAAARINRIAEPPAIIFVTAFGDHALAAFDAEAVDYLLKPVRRERLSEALQKARRLNRAQLKALQQTVSDGRRQHLLCRRRGDLELIPIDDVRFLQADQKYVTVNHLGGEDLIEDSLRQL
ncbi:MAG TPA: response regulator, partial [Gammaproteobacteria bacterium]|nr:response regulator [Gammaproteobacteria bacterium]